MESRRGSEVEKAREEVEEGEGAVEAIRERRAAEGEAREGVEVEVGPASEVRLRGGEEERYELVLREEDAET